MTMPRALEVHNLTKTYRLYRSPKDRLRELFSLNAKKHHREFLALDDVSFAVEQGETIGIIGQNGSGKSTLLKILCGVTRPTSGSVEVSGRVSSLLELGAGFDPEFTGRENVYMSGSLMGFSRADMDRLFPEIEAFAEIGDFIDQPVKRYSSGMFVRLAFSTAITVTPDIMVIDEALAVGDMGFQLKCLERLKAFQRSGRTIVLVTHHIHTVRNFCSRALWLDHGRCQASGDVMTVTDAYNDFVGWARSPGDEGETVVQDSGVPLLSIQNVVVTDANLQPVENVEFGKPFAVTVSYRLDQEYDGLVGAVAVLGRGQVNVCGVNTKRDGVALPSKPGLYELTVQYPECTLLPGTYQVRVAFLESAAVGRISVRPNAASFTVRSDAHRAEGLCLLEHRWAVKEVPETLAASGPST